MTEIPKRNLIVLGPTGVGKSTVVNHILAKDVFPVSNLMEGVTRERRTSEEETEIETRDAKGKVEYRIKMIDTVGVRDKVAQRGKEIVDDINDYLSRKAPEGVNLILFIMRKGIFLKEEKKIFESVIKGSKKNISSISALIVTGCEGLSDDDREEEIVTIKNGPDTKTFAASMGKGIYPVGFPSVANLKQPLKEEFEEEMKKDAEELRKLVLGCADVMPARKPEENIMNTRILVSAALILTVAFLVYDDAYGAKYTRRLLRFYMERSM